MQSSSPCTGETIIGTAEKVVSVPSLFLSFFFFNKIRFCVCDFVFKIWQICQIPFYDYFCLLCKNLRMDAVLKAAFLFHIKQSILCLNSLMCTL